MWRKGLVLAIILLFVGASVIPLTGMVNKSINLVGEDKNTTVIKSNNIEDVVYASSADFLENNVSSKYYGFIINVYDDQEYDVQTNICKLLNAFFQENVTVFWICENISVLSKSLGEGSDIINRIFERGIFIVPFIENHYLNSIATAIVNEYNLSKNVEIYHLNEPIYNIKIHMLIEPRIAYYDRSSIDWASYFTCLSEAGFRHNTILTPEDVLNNLTNENFNLFIIGGLDQSGNEFCDYLHPITFPANWKIKKFVKSGGGFVGSCGGGIKAATGYRRPIMLPTSWCYLPHNFIPFQIRIVDRAIYRALPGAGGTMSGGNGVTVKIVNQSCPVSFGLPEIINKTNYWAGPMFLKKIGGSPKSEDLGVIVGFDDTNWDWDLWMKDHFPFWFNRTENNRKRVIDRWIEYSKGKAIWVTAKHGDGKIVVFGDHPEYCAWHWGNTSKRIVYNAVLFSTSEGPYFVDIDYFWP